MQHVKHHIGVTTVNIFVRVVKDPWGVTLYMDVYAKTDGKETTAKWMLMSVRRLRMYVPDVKIVET